MDDGDERNNARQGHSHFHYLRSHVLPARVLLTLPSLRSA